MLAKTLKNNAFFLVPYLILMLCLIPFIIIYPKADIHLWINYYNAPVFDWLFTYLTLLGDGWFLVLPAVIILFFSLRHFVFLLSAYFGTGLVTQILKRAFFEDVARPFKYFHDKMPLHLIDGVQMLSGRSFPSGHSTSAFALFLCLAMISKNNTVKFICFIFACLVAFSRVYLSQHFLIDTMAGSMIGITGAVGFYLIYYKDDRKWHFWSLKKLFSHEK